MKYISTRAQAPKLNFSDTMLAGLASDGGLYLPTYWPQLDKNTLRSFKDMTYAQVAFTVIKPFVDTCVDDASLKEITEQVYNTFSAAEVAPTKRIKDNIYVCELFHGPTLAFKDFGLQLLAHLFEYILKKRNKKITIVGATSGDTGSAAIEACKHKPCIDVFMLHPLARPSNVQRLQMTTVNADNIYNVALKGTFDDCQNIVKKLLKDQSLRTMLNLSAVNSINWARIMAQIVYYIYAATRIGSPDVEVSFSVPTGNFGNVLAGYFAMKMGLPIKKLMVASNANDILTRFFTNKDMSIKEVVKTYSPSMDIQISSNFGRLMFENIDRDAKLLCSIMQQFDQKRVMPIPTTMWKRITEVFQGFSLGNAETLKAIKTWYRTTGEIFEPHSIIALEATKYMDTTVPTICMATAHMAKFSDTVEKATGKSIVLPKFITALFSKKEYYDTLENSYDDVVEYIKTKKI